MLLKLSRSAILKGAGASLCAIFVPFSPIEMEIPNDLLVLSLLVVILNVMGTTVEDGKN